MHFAKLSFYCHKQKLLGLHALSNNHVPITTMAGTRRLYITKCIDITYSDKENGGHSTTHTHMHYCLFQQVSGYGSVSAGNTTT